MYDKKASLASYNDSNGLITINLAHYKIIYKKKTKLMSAIKLMEIICHEFAHERVAPHNQDFTERFEDLLDLTRTQIEHDGNTDYIIKHVMREM
jgi:hypothetical protein